MLRTPPGGLPSLQARGRNTPATGIARLDAPSLPTLSEHRRNTPSIGVPRFAVPVAATPATPSVARLQRDVLAITGTPDPSTLSAAIGERLAIAGLVHLTIDLDGAAMLEDDLAVVLRRARAAAGAANIELELRATRTGARRWLSRHGFAEGP